MAQLNSSAFRLAALFGILAAMGYALQHPFSKPLASRLTGSVSETLAVILVTEIIIFVAMMLLLAARPRALRSVIELYREPLSFRRLTYQMLVGLASLLIYIFAIGKVDQVFLAVILNCFPFWFILVGITLFREEIGRDYMHKDEVALFAVLLIFIVGFGYDSLVSTSLIYVAIFSLIPILYGVLYFVRVRFFGHHTPFVYLIAANLFSIAVIAPICGIVVFSQMSLSDFDSFFGLDLALYVIGAVSSLAALYCLHRGGAVAPETAWVPAFMLFLVPSFTAVFSFMTNMFTNFDLKFDLRYLWLVVVLSVCLILKRYFDAKRSPKQKSTA